jgi:AcrR family transcriptional regulator
MYASESPDRLSDILDVAAQLFAAKGYSGTSIRDVAERVGMLSGSLYHHIKSKDDLFLQVHGRALARAGDRLGTAIRRYKDPWKRLEVACITFCQILWDPNSMVLAFTDDMSRLPPSIRADLYGQYKKLDTIFESIIDALPLEHSINRVTYQQSLRASLTGTAAGHLTSDCSPSDQGKQIYQIFSRCAII